MSELRYWIWLTAAFGCANAAKWNAVSYYGSAENAYQKISGGDLSHVLPQFKRSVESATLDSAERMIDFCASKNIGVCSFEDELFPQRLREIYNPPSVLFYKGDILGIDESVVITAVGTRNPSEYSVEVSQKLCRELASEGVSIASGFAVGLDSVAHRSAIEGGGKTYAVLPCGLLVDFPPENAGAKPLIERHGALISEYFPADRTTSIGFRARNRILSGISLGTLVLQAGAKSGSLSTASFALSQGRDIFCVPPHELFNSDYAGVIGLIRDGAIPVFESSDVINEYKGLYPHKLRTDKPQAVQKAASAPKKRAASKPKPEKTSGEKTDAPKLPPVSVRPEGLSGTKKLIYEYIRENGEVHLDQLDIGTGDVFEIEAFLTELELDGLVRSLPGNRFTV